MPLLPQSVKNREDDIFWIKEVVKMQNKCLNAMHPKSYWVGYPKEGWIGKFTTSDYPSDTAESLPKEK